MENIVSEFINNIKENNIQAVNEMLDKNPSLLYSEDEIGHPAFFVAANSSSEHVYKNKLKKQYGKYRF